MLLIYMFNTLKKTARYLASFQVNNIQGYYISY